MAGGPARIWILGIFFKWRGLWCVYTVFIICLWLEKEEAV